MSVCVCVERTSSEIERDFHTLFKRGRGEERERESEGVSTHFFNFFTCARAQDMSGQRSQTRGPRATCGPPEVFVQPASASTMNYT